MTEFTPIQQYFSTNLPGISFAFSEPMSRHTSFRIGGNAEVMAFPKSADELAALLHISGEIGCACAVLGAGTNVLAPDAGLSGLVICLKDALDGLQCLENGRIRVMAGVTMTRAAVYAANHGLSGMEFAHGIPGTVGGGVYMNAGAYGGEICQICESVDVMDRDGNVRTLSGSEMDFSYRHSRLETEGGIVISAVFRLTPAEPEQIKAKMRELQAKRSTSQPLDKPSAGSAFKRPAQGYAAALIDQAGLKGYRVGDAAVSEKHAGFAVNLGSASADDVKQLLQQVSDIVYEKSGVRLEPEVRIW
ncbi:MAG: UDP-N-acetylmuramate dehydrogenase [Ruminococcaceae bacterium]|nr:UDP-N-acetylmuramate dehydrogenase [Oscillospiraceae bacterium]